MRKYYVKGELIEETELESIFEKLVEKYENYFLHNKHIGLDRNIGSKEDIKKYPLTVYPRPISRPIFPKI